MNTSTAIPVDRAELDRDRLIEIKRYLKAQAATNAKGTFGWARFVLARVDTVLGRQNRLDFLFDAFGRRVETSKDLTTSEMFALLMWARPAKHGGGVTFSPDFIHDLSILQVAYNNQKTLPGM